MKNTNYALIVSALIVIVVLVTTSYLGVMQLQDIRIDEGTELITKNITVWSKEVVNRQYIVTDTDNISYITSEQTELRMTKGRNYTISVSTFNNQTGYWILSSTEIKQQKQMKRPTGEM